MSKVPSEVVENLACQIIEEMGWHRDDCIVLPVEGGWAIYGHGQTCVKFTVEAEQL